MSVKLDLENINNKKVNIENNNINLDIKEVIKKEYKKCIVDPVYFMSKYCVIQHPLKGKIPFLLYDFQKEVLNNFRDNEYNIILKSRQLGLSTLVAGYSLWYMMFNTDKNILVIATKQDVAKNLVTKVRIMHQNLPSWLKNDCIEDNKLSLKFKNGSQIKAIASSPEGSRSEALSLLILDEAGFIQNIDDIWIASQQTLATGGSCIALSTPNGVGGWFHKTWTDATDGLNKFKPLRLHWSVHPDRDENWRNKQDRLLGEKMANQECDASFLSSGNTFIPIEIIEWYSKTYRKEPIEKRGIDGNLWIWEYPDYNKDYMVVADVARGDGNDYSAFHVLSIDDLLQVAEYKGKMSTKDFGNLCVNISSEYNNALLVIENANVGWASIQSAIDRNYPNLFYSSKDLSIIDVHSSLIKRYDLKDNSSLIPGFSTTMKTRPLILSKLDEYIRNKEVIIQSKRLLDELMTFIWNSVRAEAMVGYNDDLVMSYAIGLWVRDTSIKLKQMGINLQKNMLSYINKSSPIINTNVVNNKNNMWEMKVNNTDVEDITWLIKK